jgi:16S rRNA (guanine966-N2)-methyltransferase
MRIISGRLKGRTLKNAPGLPVRPTTDFAKTGLFNILTNQYYLDEIRFLDLFAGTGSIGFEAWSRGCEDVTMVDNEVKCIRYIEKHMEFFGIKGIRLVKADVKHFCQGATGNYDLVFADPPYEESFVEQIPGWVLDNDLLTPEGQFILEHSQSHDFSAHPNFTEMRKYGNVRFTFFGKSHNSA